MKKALFRGVILFFLIATLVPDVIELAIYGGIFKKEAEQFPIEQRKQDMEIEKLIEDYKK